MKLVFIENNRPVTDSLTVADSFDKRHDRVLQDIRELGCSEQFRLHHFVESTYTNGQGRSMPRYLMTEQGFTLLAMGYTGLRAMEFKESYIAEFDRLRLQINQPTDVERFLYNPDTIIKIAQNWKEEKELRLLAEAKIEADKPKVLFAESLQVSDDTINVNDLAKLLKQNGVNIGEIRLFKWLRENGYLIKSGSEYNMPTQRSMELKLFKVKVTTRQGSDGTPRQQRTPKVTGKGQLYFINKFISQAV